MAGYLLAGLEAPYARTNWDDLPEADAVVVLGGIASGSEYEITGLDFSARADRIMTGVELIRQEKSKVLVVGGGGYLKEGQWRAEADRLRPWMADIVGGPRWPIWGLWKYPEEAEKFFKLVKERLGHSVSRY